MDRADRAGPARGGLKDSERRLQPSPRKVARGNGPD